jgi:hypothetical protein
MAAGERLMVMESEVVRRVAVSSIAWLELSRDVEERSARQSPLQVACLRSCGKKQSPASRNITQADVGQSVFCEVKKFFSVGHLQRRLSFHHS